MDIRARTPVKLNVNSMRPWLAGPVILFLAWLALAGLVSLRVETLSFVNLSSLSLPPGGGKSV